MPWSGLPPRLQKGEEDNTSTRVGRFCTLHTCIHAFPITDIRAAVLCCNISPHMKHGLSRLNAKPIGGGDYVTGGVKLSHTLGLSASESVVCIFESTPGYI